MRHDIIRLSLAGLTIVMGCVESETTVDDQSFFIEGTVLDVSTSSPLGGVIVGFRNPSVPDTVVFRGDSVSLSNPYGIVDYKATDNTGAFRFELFLATRDTLRYRYMFAYKADYVLWRYDRTPVPVTQVNATTDRLEIRLQPR